jgi:2-hydroxychromene-2-carboxylate isomerase
MQEVEFFFGLGSRYSYLAFTQIARIEASHSCTFNLQPIGSGELLNLFTARPCQGSMSGIIAAATQRRGPNTIVYPSSNRSPPKIIV